MADIDPNGLFIGHDLDAEGPLTLDPADLTTHGVIVGMTGSGKTGLGIDLLEDALLQGIPCLVIDPKGDMGNLLLTFPELRPEDFRPWIEDGAAARAGITPDQLAADTARAWRDGLARSGIAPDRIARLRQAAGFTIYTPGSTAGVPLDLIGSLQAPEATADVEALADEVEGLTSGLLGLIGIEADPLASPEHILISNLVQRSWAAGQDLDLATLLGQIQDPPMRKLGVLDLDTFYPARDRAQLAVRLNGLLASPSFAAWNQGRPLDIDDLLSAGGKPQAAIISISHLSDAERMFVVTLVLSRMVTWTRRRSGTGSLRAMIYMDEVFGYVPPTAVPPAKKPILTILKQARAHGVGMVLSTQNPVDLDYKAISNAGTWMIGRLQTERDKSRLLDGMTSAAGEVDRAAIDATISGLDKRQFLLHSTRSDTPTRFSTRWAMSYLAGPLTRDQIKRLVGEPPAGPTRTERSGAATGSGPSDTASMSTPALAADETTVSPEVAADTTVYYLGTATPWAAQVGVVPGESRLSPALIARVVMLFDDTRADVHETVEWEALLPISGPDPDWAEAVHVDYDARDLRREPPPGARYVLTAAPIRDKSWFRSAASGLRDYLYREEAISLQVNRELKLFSRIDETPDAFAERCRAAADDRKDEEVSKIRDRLAARMDKLNEAIAKYEDRIAELTSDVRNQQTQDLISIGSSVLGNILGGRTSTSTIARSAGRAATRSGSSAQRIRTIENRIGEKNLAIEDLEDDLQDAIAEIDHEWDEKAGAIERLEIRLEKNDITVDEVGLIWLPTS
jgi:Helicase HerA, central domain